MEPGKPLRLLAVALVLATTAVVIAVVLSATDTLLSVWERLDRVSVWLSTGFAAFLVLAALVSAWFSWRLMTAKKPVKQRLPDTNPQDLEARLDRAAALGVEVSEARQELAQLELRSASEQIDIALFGEMSSGKSSLINALLPGSQVETCALGGTTRSIGHYHWQPADGLPIRLTDLPGFGHSDTRELLGPARDEAIRAHVVLYVCDGDLTREQFTELTELAGFGKPLIVIINKSDRFDEQELFAIETRIRERLDQVPALAVISISAGGTEQVKVIDADGQQSSQSRTRPTRVQPLISQLLSILSNDQAELVNQQRQSSLRLAAGKLASAERQYRSLKAETLVERYSRRAVLGALAAITPGSDLVIQGVLATSLMTQLCQLFERPIQDINLDQFLTLAGGRVGKTTAVVLAVAGNALKAFPGAGTIAGGIVHAIAYGMIFDSLGRAAANCLAEGPDWNPKEVAQQFETILLDNMETRAGHFARLAISQIGKSKKTD
jgi:small GTP-binding protein